MPVKLTVKPIVKHALRPLKLSLAMLAWVWIGNLGCTPTRIIAPLDPGMQQVSVSAGGPMLNAAGNIPLPLLSASYARGITTDVTVYGGLHLISALYKNIHIDAGVNYGLLAPRGARPGLSLTGAVNGLWGLRENVVRLYPELTGNVYWLYRRGMPYVSLDTWFDPWYAKHTGPNPRWAVVNLAVGHQWFVGKRLVEPDQGENGLSRVPWTRWSFDTEVKYGAMNVPGLLVNEIDTLNIGGYGAFAAFIGASWRMMP